MEQPRVSVKIEQTKLNRCSNCNLPFFEERLIIRTVPGILIGAPQSQRMAFKVNICSNCGNLHEDAIQAMTPEEIKEFTIIKEENG